VSDHSTRKDKRLLPPAYHAAGVREYWVADARPREPLLEVLRHRPAGYEPAPADAEGFIASEVLGRKVRLARSHEAAGLVAYSLDIRE
jgi:hypothetical protein